MNENRKLIPGLFTVCNLFFGFFAIIKILDRNLYTAAWLIILAIICDGLDGKLARIGSSESPFGQELDALSDLISAGIAPALLIYYGRLGGSPALGLLSAFSFVMAGAYRLARFNVIQAGGRERGYLGLPLPVAGMTIASLWIFLYPLVRILEEPVLIGLMLLLSFLMTTTIRYDWPKFTFKGKLSQIGSSLFIVVCILAFVIFPRFSIFPFFIIYIILGIARYVADLIMGRTRITRLFSMETGDSGGK